MARRGEQGIRAWVWIGAVCLAVWGCSKGPGGGAKKIPRDKDAQAVVVIEAPGETSVSFTDEVEPNDEAGAATPLALGAGVRGTLDGETDVDMYRVTVTEPGLLEARLSGIEGVDLMLDLMAADAGADAGALARSDRGPAMMIEGIPNYRVEPGEYRLVVREFVKKRRKRKKGKQDEPEGRVGPSPRYELVVHGRPAAARLQEIEPNESMEQATETFLGDEVQGYMGWARDVDLWKLSIEGFSSQYSLDVDVEGVPEVTFTMRVLDDEGRAVVTRKGRKGEGLSVRNLVVVPADSEEATGTAAGAGADGKPAPRYFYAKLSARRSNPIDMYRLRMSTRLLDLDEEVEPNDEPGEAMALRQDAQTSRGVRRGHLTVGDVDRYRLDAGDEPVLLLVSVKPSGEPGAAIDAELQVTVDGKTLGMANAQPSGGEESLPDLRLDAGAGAIITVAGKGALVRDAGYQLEWSVEPVAGVPLDDGGDLGLGDYDEE